MGHEGAAALRSHCSRHRCPKVCPHGSAARSSTCVLGSARAVSVGNRQMSHVGGAGTVGVGAVDGEAGGGGARRAREWDRVM